ncbi:ExbD/TolR family protein [Haloferula sp.]|uniref:ExbD/TolR family protein n=1 Tax=Haloferula sp. TaxID=2497595 RepID=UPI00329B899E
MSPFDDEEEADVSMSPMIDCVFLLLIFFLVSTMTKKEDRDIEILLPQSTSAAKVIPSDDFLVIGVDVNGGVFVDGEETTLNRLHLLLREVGVGNPEQYVRLDADEATPLHRVVEVLDLCEFNNLANVGIRTYDEYYNRR